MVKLLSGCSVSPSVSQVVGVKDERLGEQVCACIRLRKDQTSSAEEIRAFCKGQVSIGMRSMKLLNILRISTAVHVVFYSTRFLTSRSHTMCTL